MSICSGKRNRLAWCGLLLGAIVSTGCEPEAPAAQRGQRSVVDVILTVRNGSRQAAQCVAATRTVQLGDLASERRSHSPSRRLITLLHAAPRGGWRSDAFGSVAGSRWCGAYGRACGKLEIVEEERLQNEIYAPRGGGPLAIAFPQPYPILSSTPPRCLATESPPCALPPVDRHAGAI